MSTATPATPATPAPPPPRPRILPPLNSNPRFLQGDDRLSHASQFNAWSRQVKNILKSCGGSVLAVFDGLERPGEEGDDAGAWDQADSIALSVVNLCIDPAVNHLTADCETSAEAKRALQQHFALTDNHGVVRLIDHLFSVRLSSSSIESVDVFIKDYRETLHGLAAAKIELQDELSVGHILSLLPSSFAGFRTAIGINSSSIGLPPLVEFFDLLRAEAQRGKPISGNASSSRSSSSRSKSAKPAGAPPSTCRVPGCDTLHWVSDCTHANTADYRRKHPPRWGRAPAANAAVVSPPALSPASAPASSPVSAAPATVSPTVAAVSLSSLLGPEHNGGVDAWLTTTTGWSEPGTYELDSGASHHLSGQRDHFLDFVPCESESVGGIGGDIAAVGTGRVALKARLENGKRGTVVLENVLFVPGIRCNLVSVSRLTKRGYEARFAGTSALVSVGDRLVARGTLNSRGLFSLDAEILLPRALANLATSSSKATLTTWHQRFCHLAPRSLQNLASKGHVKGLEISDCSSWCGCNACQVGKAHRLPFPSSDKRATRKLELVHSDLIDFSTPSLGGRRYAILFTDDFSRKTWIFPLGRKSDAYDAWKQWRPRAELESGERVRKLRTDNGGEYLGHAWTDELTARGIAHELSQPYTPQHNSRAERPNRSLAEGILAMLAESGLPNSFWAEAGLAFTLVKNKSPHRALNGNVPDAVWTGRPVTVDFLRSFGCLAWMTILKDQEQRKKLDPKGRRVVFIGYQPDVKAYRLYDPETKLIHISRDVVFDETVFPLSKQFKFGGGQLNSAPPSVRPGVSSESGTEVPLILLDERGNQIERLFSSSPSSPTPSASSSAPPVVSPNRFAELNDESLDYIDIDNERENEHRSPSPPPAPKSQRFVQ